MLKPEGQDLLLICYPPDKAFENGVRTAVDEVGGSGSGTAEAVVLRLHELYPGLRIVVHEPHGPGAAHQRTWIVFRDRHERQRHERQRHERQRREQRGRQPVALVVDDEPLARLLLSVLLAGRGWRVIQASDGNDALAKADGTDLDLLVTDYEMPGMDGWTLARHLCDRDPRLPVLVVSGQPGAASWVEGVRTAFLAKPFGIEDVGLRVESLTGYPTAWSSDHSAGV
jgi:CheY-like chemotaxis protein